MRIIVLLAVWSLFLSMVERDWAISQLNRKRRLTGMQTAGSMTRK